MVNTGKPSRGCYMCRARRIKCDEGKPNCMRCQKSKRVCPGYRDAFELNLRDETKSTKKKISRLINSRLFFGPDHESQVEGLAISISHSSAFDDTLPTWRSSRKTHSNNGSISSISSQSTVSSAGSNDSSRYSGFISHQISTPIDQQAACFFLANFVLLPEQGTLRGYLDFILPHLRKDKPDPCLSVAFAAVAIASLGTRPNSKALLPQADLCYVKALTKINSTLRDPKTASSDSALCAVLLLSFFEQVTAPRMTHQAWNSHVDGATALLKARGPKEFQNPTGREMWHCVRALATIQHLANSKAVDHDWWMAVPPTDISTRAFASLNLRVANLKADTEKATSVIYRTTTNHENVLNLLRRAQDLEEEYRDWFTSLPPSWQTKSEAWFEDDGTIDYATSVFHPGRIDSYSEMWIAYHTNVARSSRIVIWSITLRCVAWLAHPRDYRLTLEYARAQQVCRPLIEDIVASCPFFFSWNKDKNAAMADKSFFACGTQDTESVKCLWGIFVMWPLFVAATSDLALPSQKMYLRGRLKYVSETMGIYQASVMLKVPLSHPSFYIERERRKMQPHTYHLEDAQIQTTPEIPKASITVPEMQSPTLATKAWVQTHEPVILENEYNGYSAERFREVSNLTAI